MNRLARYAFSIGAAAAFLVSCTQPPTGAPLTQAFLRPAAPVRASSARPGATQGLGTVFALTTSGKETVLHSFGGGSADGANPHGSLLNVDGTLYGTSRRGGTYDGGTVFAITPSGSETVLHSFGGSGDGASPMAGLIDVGGTLYGTTHSGGVASSACAHGCGVVFSITPSGTEVVLHSFEGYPSDGAYPVGDLLDVNGTFYGTTRAGGSVSCASGAGCGTVFTITPSGGESVLFSFGAHHEDCCPSGGLVDVSGALYGTTLMQYGKIFRIGTSGGEASIHKFKGYPKDGADPNGGLIDVSGTLYGTTLLGGAHKLGTVFSATTSGKETELYSFSGAQGERPVASLTNVNGALYGTASQGGAKGNGAVFAVTTSGAESVIYSFAGYPSDGADPHGGLIDVKGTFYGTTEYGGSN